MNTINIICLVLSCVYFVSFVVCLIIFLLWRKEYKKMLNNNKDEHIILRKNQNYLNRGLRDLKVEAQNQVVAINKLKATLQVKLYPVLNNDMIIKSLTSHISDLEEQNKRCQEILKSAANSIDYENKKYRNKKENEIDE